MSYGIGLNVMQLKTSNNYTAKGYSMTAIKAALEAFFERMSQTESLDRDLSYLNNYYFLGERGDFSGRDIADWLIDEHEKASVARQESGRYKYRKDSSVGITLVAYPDSRWTRSMSDEELEALAEDLRRGVSLWIGKPVDAEADHFDEGWNEKKKAFDGGWHAHYFDRFIDENGEYEFKKRCGPTALSRMHDVVIQYMNQKIPGLDGEYASRNWDVTPHKEGGDPAKYSGLDANQRRKLYDMLDEVEQMKKELEAKEKELDENDVEIKRKRKKLDDVSKEIDSTLTEVAAITGTDTTQDGWQDATILAVRNLLEDIQEEEEEADAKKAEAEASIDEAKRVQAEAEATKTEAEALSLGVEAWSVDVEFQFEERERELEFKEIAAQEQQKQIDAEIRYLTNKAIEEEVKERIREIRAEEEAAMLRIEMERTEFEELKEEAVRGLEYDFITQTEHFAAVQSEISYAEAENRKQLENAITAFNNHKTKEFKRLQNKIDDFNDEIRKFNDYRKEQRANIKAGRDKLKQDRAELKARQDRLALKEEAAETVLDTVCPELGVDRAKPNWFETLKQKLHDFKETIAERERERIRRGWAAMLAAVDNIKSIFKGLSEAALSSRDSAVLDNIYDVESAITDDELNNHEWGEGNTFTLTESDERKRSASVEREFGLWNVEQEDEDDYSL